VSCGENNSLAQNPAPKNVPKMLPNDSTTVIWAFEKLKTNKIFLKDLGLENEKEFSWNDDLIKIISGDLNNDGIADALMFFVIEGRGHGNNADAHYAIFLNEDNKWNYQCQIDAGGDWAERLTQLDEIKNGKIKGNMIGNKNKSLPDVPVEFIYKNKSFINTYTALHKTDNEEREFLKIENIITSTDKIIPTTGTLQSYEQVLGKGRITVPEEQPECGTYFEEGVYSDWYYEHNLRIELSDNKRAAWRSVFIRGTDYTINTDKGTITANTTLEELKNIFYKEDSWQIDDEEDGGKTFRIPDGPESDTQLHISFSKDGKLEGVLLWIPC